MYAGTGAQFDANGTPEHADSPSLIVEAPEVTVEIEHSIVGGLRVVEGAQVRIAHSIVDATSETGAAYAALDGTAAGGALQIVDSTVIGTVHTVLLELASNTIFLAALAPAPEEKADTQLAPIMAQRRQAGCVRFSSLPLSAVVPPRFAVSRRVRVRQDDCARSSPRCIMAIRAMGNSPHTVP